MNVYQIVQTLSQGDAIGNDVKAMDTLLREHGYQTQIFAEKIKVNISRVKAERMCNFPKVSPEDMVIYHVAGRASAIVSLFRRLKCRKVIVYHNITPPYFFSKYNRIAEGNSRDGLNELLSLREDVNACIADSCFDKSDLQKMGFSCPIHVLPIIIPMHEYEKLPDENVIHKFNDNVINVLFVGRIAPNKCQEDIIRCVSYYAKHYHNRIRLLLVGSYDGMERYYEALQEFVKMFPVEVIFTGRVSFAELLSYYTSADIFISMSEHEGFCVPLIEAMLFNLPIIAYRSSAITETLGRGGILVETKDEKQIAGIMHRVLNDTVFRDAILSCQQDHLFAYRYENTSKKFLNMIQEIAISPNDLYASQMSFEEIVVRHESFWGNIEKISEPVISFLYRQIANVYPQLIFLLRR